MNPTASESLAAKSRAGLLRCDFKSFGLLCSSWFQLLLMFQIEKVLTGFPADYGGVHEEDFLVSINGQGVFEMNHAQVVGLIKNSGATLRLAVER